MKFLHFTWRGIRALLITMIAVICMAALSPLWWVILLLLLACPRPFGILWNRAANFKVF